MTIRVVTLMYGTAWERYGQRFAETFHRFWPADVDLVVVTDRQLPLPRGRQIDLSLVPGLLSFRERHASNPVANGRNVPEGMKRDENGYSWRLDAMKWMPQGLAPAAALDGLRTDDILVWMDADVETISAVPRGWVEGLLGDGDVACLQRERTHSEIGFYAVRMWAGTRDFLREFANFYTDGRVFLLRESHSAFIFDRALETSIGLTVTNLNTRGGKGHVWPFTRLAEHTVHHKGKRKDKR